MKTIVGWLRSLKNWVEAFSEKPYAMPALFILSFAEASFFPIPPDVLLIAIAVANYKRALIAALWCTLGSVLGGMLGYYIGAELMETIGNPIIATYGFEAPWEKFVSSFNENGTWFLAAAAFTPIPYKVATIASGATHIDFVDFSLISSVGRAGRFFLVAGLLSYFGPQFKEVLDKYFDKLSLALVVLVILGFVAIKYIL